MLSNFLSNVGGSLYAAAQRVDPKAIADTVAAAAGQVSERVAATAGQVSERLLSSAEQAALETKMKHLQSEAANDAAAATVGIAPWLTLGEQFSILEDELKLRILKIASNEANFTKSTALEVRRRPGNILPGCLPMAEAALTEDAVLKALRFKLVPASKRSFGGATFGTWPTSSAIFCTIGARRMGRGAMRSSKRRPRSHLWSSSSSQSSRSSSSSRWSRKTPSRIWMRNSSDSSLAHREIAVNILVN